MTYIAVTSAVVINSVRGTRSDALDQRWWPFLRSCDLVGLQVPNEAASAVQLMRRLPIRGVLLTGGNDLAELGGDAPERDRTEMALLDFALGAGLPVVGVCRGMQLLLRRFGVALHRVAGHVTPRQTVFVDGRARVVNSYHNWAALDVKPPLRAWATGPDDVIKGIRHDTEPLLGIMWHPERLPQSLARDDHSLIRQHFGATA